MNDELKKATATATDDLDKAKKIYEYVRDNFTCTDDDAVFLSQPLKKTFDSKKGNVVDINLLLTAMFLNRGYTATPIILSTRNNGRASETYPLLDKFNYVISRVLVNNNYYLLDATNPLLGFGHLGENCYNGSGRVIETLPLLVPLSADSLKETEVSSTFIINGSKGLEGTVTSSPGYYKSTEIREKLLKTSQNEYFSGIKKSYVQDVDISNTSIDSLKLVDNPVKVQYDINFSNTSDDDIIYFSPMLSKAIKDNPFKSAERLYPVEMPYCTDEIYTLNMETPKGYTIDELPKSVRVNLNENDRKNR
jgi:hypothetical protein